MLEVLSYNLENPILQFIQPQFFMSKMNFQKSSGAEIQDMGFCIFRYFKNTSNAQIHTNPPASDKQFHLSVEFSWSFRRKENIY